MIEMFHVFHTVVLLLCLLHLRYRALLILAKNSLSCGEVVVYVVVESQHLFELYAIKQRNYYQKQSDTSFDVSLFICTHKCALTWFWQCILLHLKIVDSFIPGMLLILPFLLIYIWYGLFFFLFSQIHITHLVGKTVCD